MNSVIIRLQNLPMSANASNIRRFFAGLNIPEGGVHIVGGEKGDAFIAFATDEDARRAMLLDHQQINSSQIRLFLSSKSEMQSVIDTARSSVMMAAQPPPEKPRKQYPTTQAETGYSNQPPSSVRISAPPQLNTDAQKSYSASSSYPSEGYPSNTQYGYYNAVYNTGRKDGEQRKEQNSDGNGYSYYHDGYGAPSENRKDDNAPAPREGSSGNDYADSGYGNYGDYNNGSSRNSYDYPSYDNEYTYGGREYSGYPRDDNRGYANTERDFSVRPPWLRDEGRSVQKRQSYGESDDVTTQKRPRGDQELPQINLDACFTIKVSMCPADVTVKNVFDILRGVNIVPKFGIRVEEDVMKRYTGNVYCLLTLMDSYQRAMAANGVVFRGKKVQVTESTVDEFFSVTDSNFQSRCPPMYANRIPPKASVKPNYHADGCMEVSEIPSDVTERDIVSFFGAPGLKVEDVKITQLSARGPVRAFVSLPSPRDLEILLGASPRPFGPNATQNVRLMAISRMQFMYAAGRSPQSVVSTSPSVPATKSPEEASRSPQSDRKTCAFMYGFARAMTSFDIAKLFPSVIMPGDAIHLINNNMAAVVDFISEANCKKALLDFSNAEASLKATHRNICMRCISRNDFEQKKSSAVPEKHASSPAPDGDRDPRSFKPSYMGPPPPRASFNSPSSRYAPPPPRGQGPYRSSAPVHVHIGNLPPRCSPDAVFDVFKPFRPLPGSVRFRRDPQGHQMGEAMIAFGSFPEADRAVREVSGYRLFGRNLAVRLQ